MHNVNGYVRDFYFFRRNFYPQLSLVHMNPTDAAVALHSQVALPHNFINLTVIANSSWNLHQEVNQLTANLKTIY